MTLQHLPRTATVEQAVSALHDQGCVVIDRLVPAETIDRVEAELGPWIEATPHGNEAGHGLRTRRTSSLIARSETVREWVMDDLVLGVAKSFLSHAATIQLSATEVITLSPGADAQFIHRDEVLFDAFPFPNDYDVYCNTLWALSDTTEEMGATRVVPGSHRLPGDSEFTVEDTVPVEMTRGSVMIFSGKLFHGGGQNRSNRERQLLDLGYAVSWVRQEENQYLACPPEIARTLPESLQRLMGYRSDNGYGHPGDRLTEPLEALVRPEVLATPSPGNPSDQS
jgi:ectoine hydroxylase-related dioxygenase (phytanoyl-CoA dioxygenase family)